jgi:hypothetical protein
LDVKTPNSTETSTPADAFRRLNDEINNLILAPEKIELLLAAAGHRDVPQYLEAFQTAQAALRRAKGGAA